MKELLSFEEMVILASAYYDERVVPNTKEQKIARGLIKKRFLAQLPSRKYPLLGGNTDETFSVIRIASNSATNAIVEHAIVTWSKRKLHKMWDMSNAQRESVEDEVHDMRDCVLEMMGQEEAKEEDWKKSLPKSIDL